MGIHGLLLLIYNIGLITSTLKRRIPKHMVSFCTYRMNLTNYYGCNTPFKGVTGVVLLVKTLKEFQHVISQQLENAIIIAMPAFMFALKTIHKSISENVKLIKGLIVLGPTYCLSKNPRLCPDVVQYLPEFSEINPCNEEEFRFFNKKSCYYNDIFGSIRFNEIKWKFPLVLLKDAKDQEGIIDCFESYNSIVVRHSKCVASITSYTQMKFSSSECIKIESTYRINILMAHKFSFCTKLSGFNIYITFNPRENYFEKSIILIITRTDTTSIFDTGAAGTRELYPTITILMSMAAIFNRTKIPPHYDILVGFLDNENLGQSGSFRLIYDLLTNQVTNGFQNISSKNIKLIISLDDFTDLTNDKIYLFLHGCQFDKELCSDFVSSIKYFCVNYRKLVILFKFPKKSNIWLDAIKVPKIDIRTAINTKARYSKSFLDGMEPGNLTLASALARIIAETSLKILLNLSIRIPPQNLSFTPDKMAHCFYNIKCTLLEHVIGPKEKVFYEKYANPFVAQSFVDGFIEAKQGKYTNRLSYFILKMMIYYLKISSEINPLCQDQYNQINFSITVNDILYCYHALIQVQTSFNSFDYSKNNNTVFKMYSVVPEFMRSSVLMEQKVEYFVSVDKDLTRIMTIIATLLTSFSFLGSVFVYRNINSIVSDDLF